MKNLKFYLFLTIIILVALYIVKVFDISYPITVVNISRTGEFSVVGEGKIEATPDTAYVDAGIMVNNTAKVDDVQKKIDEVNNKIVDGLKSLGIQKGDIKTSNYSINPNYDYMNNSNRITGYNGNVTISIKVKDTSLVSKVVEEVTADGANQVNGVRFVIDDPAKFREEARNAAIANAKEQAQKLASTLGIRLGKISNIVESSQGGQPVPMYDMARSAGMGGVAVAPQIEPGSQTISSVVTLYFEKK